MDKAYIGHMSQVSGVEEHRLVGGRGDGMRLFLVRNGRGLEFTVSADRCADISRLSVDGVNLGYFSPVGYVAPSYYDGVGNGFLKSFTAGFLTTCGLYAVGTPCHDDGEDTPLHGSVGNTPAESIQTHQTEDAIVIQAKIDQSEMFGRKLVLYRTITCSTQDNRLSIRDRIVNEGDRISPCMVLYHMNMGYPLLSETAELAIPSEHVSGRTAKADKGISHWQEITKPQPQFEEECFYHQFTDKGLAGIYNPAVQKGLVISYDAKQLPYFVQWKMMGEREYVLGLEPGNCHPDGRDKMRQSGNLAQLQPGEEVSYCIDLHFFRNESDWRNGFTRINQE